MSSSSLPPSRGNRSRAPAASATKSQATGSSDLTNTPLAPPDGFVHTPRWVGGATRETFAPRDGEAVVEKLAEGVAERLPASATLLPQHRERLVARAREFDKEIKELALTQFSQGSSLKQLKDSLPAHFASDAPIEFHAVASHFLPETLQAYVKDRQGAVTVFVRNSEGRWVEHPALTQRIRQGLPPSMAPGMETQEKTTLTLGIAQVFPNGGVEFRIPSLQHFNHQPRLRPFQPGDVVQCVQPTGQTQRMQEGEPYVATEEVQFGTLRSTDGKGEWVVDLLDRSGAPALDAQGQVQQKRLTDEELRELNNPTLLREGDRLYDSIFNPKDEPHQAWMKEFDALPEIQKLLKERPSLDADASERARWEKNAVEAIDFYLDGKMKYPTDQGRLSEYDRSIEQAKKQLEELKAAPPPPPQPRPANGIGFRFSGFSPPTVESVQKRLEELQDLKSRTEKHYLLERTGSNIAAYAQNGFGVCRHQAIAMQVLLQQMGIDSRMTRGAATMGASMYFGEHMWLEGQFSDGSVWMIDPTWSSGRPDLSRLQHIYLQQRDRIEKPTDSKQDYGRQVTN